MAKWFNTVANVLFPLRRVFILLSICAFIGIVTLFVFSPVSSSAVYLVPTLLVFLWGLLLFAFSHSFSGNKIENNETIKQGFFTRLKKSFFSLLLWLYSVFFIVLLLASMHFTVKVITL